GHAKVERVRVGVLEPLTFRSSDVIDVAVVELRKDLLLHQADQRFGEAERGLVEIGVDALLGPACVTRLSGDYRGRVEHEGLADADGSLRTVVALQRSDAASDIPRSRGAWEPLIVRPTREQAMPLDVGVDACGIVFTIVRRRNFTEIVVGTAKPIAGQVRDR